jgi:hypothetical protein
MISGVATFFWRPERVTAMVPPNRNYEIKKIKTIYTIFFYLGK